MKILALDNATGACCISLLCNGKSCHADQRRGQATEHLLANIARLLATSGVSLSELDALALGCGPGQFTSLRVTAAVIQAFAFVHQRPVLLIPSLQSLAQRAYMQHRAQRVLVALPAHQEYLYWAAYAYQSATLPMAACYAPRLVSASAIPRPCGSSWLGVGAGFYRYKEQLSKQLGPQLAGRRALLFPRADALLWQAQQYYRMRRWVSAEKALPIYLAMARLGVPKVL